MYRDKKITPYITRITVKEAPKTIIHDDTVFQNLKIIYIKNNPVHQYQEIPAVKISSIELRTSIPIKFEVKESEVKERLQKANESEHVLTVRQLRALLRKCPCKAKVFLGKLNSEKEKDEANNSQAIQSVESRFCKKDAITQVWLHNCVPTWKDIEVKIIREFKDKTFTETSYDYET
jgi:hypothetical protein